MVFNHQTNRWVRVTSANLQRIDAFRNHHPGRVLQPTRWDDATIQAPGGGGGLPAEEAEPSPDRAAAAGATGDNATNPNPDPELAAVASITVDPPLTIKERTSEQLHEAAQTHQRVKGTSDAARRARLSKARAQDAPPPPAPAAVTAPAPPSSPKTVPGAADRRETSKATARARRQGDLAQRRHAQQMEALQRQIDADRAEAAALAEANRQANQASASASASAQATAAAGAAGQASAFNAHMQKHRARMDEMETERRQAEVGGAELRRQRAAVENAAAQAAVDAAAAHQAQLEEMENQTWRNRISDLHEERGRQRDENARAEAHHEAMQEHRARMEAMDVELQHAQEGAAAATAERHETEERLARERAEALAAELPDTDDETDDETEEETTDTGTDDDVGVDCGELFRLWQERITALAQGFPGYRQRLLGELWPIRDQNREWYAAYWQAQIDDLHAQVRGAAPHERTPLCQFGREQHDRMLRISFDVYNYMQLDAPEADMPDDYMEEEPGETGVYDEFPVGETNMAWRGYFDSINAPEKRAFAQMYASSVARTPEDWKLLSHALHSRHSCTHRRDVWAA